MICPKCHAPSIAVVSDYAWRCDKGHIFDYEMCKNELLVEVRVGKTAFLSSRRLDDLFRDGLTRIEGERWFKAGL